MILSKSNIKDLLLKNRCRNIIEIDIQLQNVHKSNAVFKYGINFIRDNILL